MDANIPNAKLLLIEDCGHYPHIEKEPILLEMGNKGTTFKFDTTRGEGVGMLRFAEMKIDPARPTHHSTLFGNQREPKSFLWLDMMRVEPKFQGTGVREAVIGELARLSEAMGHGGRIKLEAANQFGTVSAIPWHKPASGRSRALVSTETRLPTQLRPSSTRLPRARKSFS